MQAEFKWVCEEIANGESSEACSLSEAPEFGESSTATFSASRVQSWGAAPGDTITFHLITRFRAGQESPKARVVSSTVFQAECPWQLPLMTLARARAAHLAYPVLFAALQGNCWECMVSLQDVMIAQEDLVAMLDLDARLGQDKLGSVTVLPKKTSGGNPSDVRLNFSAAGSRDPSDFSEDSTGDHLRWAYSTFAGSL